MVIDKTNKTENVEEAIPSKEDLDNKFPSQLDRKILHRLAKRLETIKQPLQPLYPMPFGTKEEEEDYMRWERNDRMLTFKNLQLITM